ncbi:hypothetical protein MMC28_000104 [Mycoblastus sanguinarius]|nr:hypothetical protein [Mycoblastus sanguinarius]
MLLPTFLPAILLAALPSLTLAVPGPPNGDPCGPTVQDTPNYPNTCNANVTLVDAPAPYGVNCTVQYPLTNAESINYTNCDASIVDICTKLTDSRTLRAHWIWSMLAPQCALGFYIPPYQGSASIPTMARCTVQIFSAMVDSCRTFPTKSNAASVNLKVFPTLSGGNSGEAVNVGYPTYGIGWSPWTSPSID